MAQNICKLLEMAVKDESEASDFYDKIKRQVSKPDKWQIDKIMKDESNHYESLKQILKRYCTI